MCCYQNTPLQTVRVQLVKYVQYVQHYCNTHCVAVRTHRYRPSQYNLLCTFSDQNITVTHNVLLSEQTITVEFFMYVQCALYYCNTQCVAIRTNRYKTSQYNWLSTFSVHNITVTHNVSLSEPTGSDRRSTIFM